MFIWGVVLFSSGLAISANFGYARGYLGVIGLMLLIGFWPEAFHHGYGWGCYAPVLGLLLVSQSLVPRFLEVRAEGKARICQENLVTLADALRAQAAKHEGRYPLKLEQLVPHPLEKLPVCPLEGPGYQELSVMTEHGFVLCCSGERHRLPELERFPVVMSRFRPSP
ncbi:MAG: hypothetical protein AMXMBFR33_72320 [Candidatus Xenobia bacterium]